ncbi:MAG TPA: hypothetical protein EYP85_16835 [Armatimonadetes bacterium]|nr:hypothetical protein [Armatimonadota bacterium]
MTSILALLCFVLGSFLASAKADDWPMFLHDAAHTGATSEQVHPPLVPRWTFTRPLGRWFTPPVAVGGRVFVGGSDHAVYALSLTTGKLLWTFATGGDIVASPCATETTVYVASTDHRLYALEASSGQRQWTFPTRANLVAAPCLAEGVLYVASCDHRLYALDAFTGELRWQFAAGADLEAAPTVHGGRVFLASRDHTLYALDAATGELCWQHTAPADWTQTLAAVGEVLYGNYPGLGLMRFATAEGQLLDPLGATSQVLQPPVLTASCAYAFTPQQWLRTSLHNGVVVYQQPIERGRPHVPPVLAGNLLYWGHEDRVLAYDTQTFRLLWQLQTLGQVTGLAVSERTLLISQTGPNLQAFASAPAQSFSEPSESVNHPPRVFLQCADSPRKRRPIRIQASVSDPDGDKVTLEWEVGEGKIVARGPRHVEVIYFTSGRKQVRATAIDSRGARGSAPLTLPIFNHPPVARAKVDELSLYLVPVRFDATSSYDPDGDRLRFEWIELLGDTPVVRHYFAPGVYEVFLKVWQLPLLGDVDAVSLEIAPAIPPLRPQPAGGGS